MPQDYKFIEGDTASGVAEKAGLTNQEFLALNPELKATGRPNDFGGLTGLVQVGQKYNLGAPKTSTGIVTSSQSQSQYNQNVSGNTAALASLSAPPPGGTYLGANAEGLQGYSGPDGAQYVRDAQGKWNVTVPAPIDPNAPKQPVPGTSAPAGTIPITGNDGNVYNVPKDSANPQAIADNLAANKANENILKQQRDALVNYNVANDPVAQAAVQRITNQYGVLIQQMEDRNKISMGIVSTGIARYGGLGEMNQNVKSEALERATARVTDLQQKMNIAIQQSNDAYKSGNVKALEAAQANYSQSLKDSQNALMDLEKEVNEQVKSNREDEKLRQEEEKQKIADDIRVSTNVAQSISDIIESSGVTDEKQIEAFINQVAQNNGITNIEVLKSAVLKARQTANTRILTDKNIKSQINSRNIRDKIAIDKANEPKVVKGGDKDGGFTYTADDITSYTSLLNEGGTAPDGTYYDKRGDDAYANTATYIFAYNDWINNNGTPEGFLKLFPISNVNPRDKSSLPAALKAKF